MSARPAPIIKRQAKQARAVSFESLRAQGVELLQALSGRRWSDHNLHDPGVTILEQLCYALTELVYRADLDLADHLTGPDGAIDFTRLSVHPPQVIFPCRPTTLADYRRVLLDGVRGIDDARLQTQGDLAGLYHLVLRMKHDGAAGPARSARQARALYLARRNLCEDLDQRATVIRDVPCTLHADIEVNGPRDPADVLAEVYWRCDGYITSRVEARSLDDLLRTQQRLEEIFDGPELQHGFFSDDDLAAADAETLFVGDLAARLQSIDGVKQIRRLALQCGDEAPSNGSAPWRGPGWALRLSLPAGAGRIPQIRLHRRDSELQVSAHDVRGKLEDLRAADQARRRAHAGASTLPLPYGEHRRLDRYYSIQNHFPAVYGIGVQGLPGSATRREKAQALQLKAYLVLFEQVLAHSAAQLQHVRDLLCAENDSLRSYWWQMLQASAVPGIEQLYVNPPEQIQQQVYERFDNYVERKDRALDYLLALYGESYSQNSLRQFWSYHAAEELEAMLLQNKAQLLKDIVRSARDRAGGFDYGQVSWDNPANCSGLQRRVSLLLGFPHAFSRSVTGALRAEGHELVPVDDEMEAAGAGRWMAQPGQVTMPVPPAEPAQVSVDPRLSLRRMAPLNTRLLSETLLRVGVYRDRYRLVEASAGAYYHLVLGPDERDGWWHLGDYVSQAAAAYATDTLRSWLLQLNHDSEGLHVVEHLLLRPVGDQREHASLPISTDFYEFRLSVLLPAWSARCHQAAFRRLAHETVRLNTPAHLAVDCYWLSYGDMLEFESRYVRWLQAKLIFTRAPSEEQGGELNDASRAVIEALLRHARAATAEERHG